MSKEMNIPKPPLEQILETTFAILEKQDEFDNETIQKLRQLSSQDDLTKQSTIRAIREGSEEENETA
ncbi:MAG: hypothetical protein ACTSYJ_03875 [Candidatus Thorarchaeota archaeon]